MEDATTLSNDTAGLPFSAAVLDILRTADRMEVLAMADDDPSPRVTGRGWVNGPGDRAEFVRQFLAADWSPDEEEMCFDVDYGVRLLARAGEVGLDFCFSCSNVRVSEPDRGRGILPFANGPGRLVRRLARRVGAVRPWWWFW